MKVLSHDLTNKGERVDLDVRRGRPRFDRLDMYQKSHLRRYELACTLVRPGMRVADLACGTGYGSVLLARQGADVVGADIAADVIASISRRYARIPNVRFARANLLELKIDPVDMIVSFETIEHFPREQVTLLFARFRQLLRPGGVLIFSTPYRQPETEASRAYHRTFEIDEATVDGWAHDAEFVIRRHYYQDYRTHEIVDRHTAPDFLLTVADSAVRTRECDP